MFLKGRFLYIIWKVLVLQKATLIITLQNGLGKKKVVYFSLWEDVGFLQGELGIKQRANKCKKSAGSPEYFNWHVSLRYKDVQDDPSDIAI